MNQYMLKYRDEDGDTLIDFFLAENMHTAQRHVEENYHNDDGAMTLYHLTPVCEWP